MQFLSKTKPIDFLGKRKLPMALSALLVIATIGLLSIRGLSFGLDFTGGTLVELIYNRTVDVSQVRDALTQAGMDDAVVQHFGTTQDVLVRLPIRKDEDSATVSTRVVEVVRKADGEFLVSARGEQGQQCRDIAGKTVKLCSIQIRRIEFVGPQVGDELATQGGLALLYTLIAVLIYVMFRFEWRFAVGAVVAIAHDVLLTFGFFSLTGVEFDLSVLAAILAVLGYSLNDTIVVFDRIRENFHKLRKHDVVGVLNTSINNTLARTIITSGTTLLVLISLLVFGGEIIHSFAIALIVGVLVGTYSSIYIATPVVLALGISRDDMMPVKKEGAEEKSLLP
ncbi:MAG: protein translocase subunit SecF [Gammaproteobacteria bacterium]|nr:MAG: protein translocase subunit SecF [Gammaproteobacteria bacterium]